jgi:hypothetical protein
MFRVSFNVAQGNRLHVALVILLGAHVRYSRETAQQLI